MNPRGEPATRIRANCPIEAGDSTGENEQKFPISHEINIWEYGKIGGI